MHYVFSQMPEPRPLPMARQDFGRAPAPQAAQHRRKFTDSAWRFAAFAPPLLITCVLTFAI
ncbi:MAG: hypothetical protein AAFY81_09815, partial [Pseudomonadota bacterium]